MAKWITRFVWLLLVVVLIVMFATSGMGFQNQATLMLVSGALILSLLAIATWLIVYYRSLFRHWWGWIIAPVLFVFSSYVTQGAIPVKWSLCSYFITMLGLVCIWATGLTSVIFLWYNDVGIRIVGWSSAVIIWLVVLAWRIHGNVISLAFSSLGRTDVLSPLWWISPLFPIMMWLIPIAIVSIIGHSIRILLWELRTE